MVRVCTKRGPCRPFCILQILFSAEAFRPKSSSATFSGILFWAWCDFLCASIDARTSKIVMNALNTQLFRARDIDWTNAQVLIYGCKLLCGRAWMCHVLRSAFSSFVLVQAVIFLRRTRSSLNEIMTRVRTRHSHLSLNHHAASPRLSRFTRLHFTYILGPQEHPSKRVRSLSVMRQHWVNWVLL